MSDVFTLHPRHHTPTWSRERVAILSGADPQDLEDRINTMLEATEYCVLAMTAAQTTATFVEHPWHLTVLYQERTTPNDVSS
jgi:hypothetical protein